MCVLNFGTFLCLSSTKQQHEVTHFHVFWRTRSAWLIFCIFFWNWTLSVHVYPEQVFRPTEELNRFTQLRHSKVKYKYIFYKASSPPSPSSCLKLHNRTPREIKLLSPSEISISTGEYFSCHQPSLFTKPISIVCKDSNSNCKHFCSKQAGCEKWTNQHDDKNQTRPWPPEHLVGAISTKLRDLTESKVI